MQQTPRTDRRLPNGALVILLAMAGCSPALDMRDQRLAEFAHQSMEEQAKQNQTIARQAEAVVQESQQLAEASKELVASDAKARQDLIGSQERLTAQLHQQRATVDAGRDQLEEERQRIADQRHRDPLLAAAIQNVGLIIACLLPLLVCIVVIRQMSSSEPDDGAVAELLVSELTSDQPRLLPGASLRSALEQHAAGEQISGEQTSGEQPGESAPAESIELIEPIDPADLPF
jgi:hypothetical protein